MLAACGPAEEPLLPELKGRWDVLSHIKESAAAAQPVRASNGAAQPATIDPCSVTYVTFSKQRIVMRTIGIPFPVYQVAGVKRDGNRVIISGGSGSVNYGKLELLLRNGEVRFDDIYDQTGRSLKYIRLPDDNPLRRYGARTLGEALQLVLDVKLCKA
jgi:hypothetical protein